ncbi:hypothetical protein D9613_001323 [Agrocybe pediades]|uniref:F-box domain-containing protein n=1 Tax=Agrocybe pediades TaxID=84607 RepID=A0A8H4VXE4_9AGAR|nr:hypothetical protein D9613_001323 [Agrocybe pediades]
MSILDDLPPEILCAIFELCLLDSEIDGRRPSVANSADSEGMPAAVLEALGFMSTGLNDDDFCKLPIEKQSTILQSLALSHVCARWRHVALEFPLMWTRIRLGRRAFITKQNSKSSDTDSSDLVEITSQLLSRSAPLPLHLDIDFLPNEPIHLPLTGMQKRRNDTNIKLVLSEYTDRSYSLRIASDETIITSVLDVFVDRNISKPTDSKTRPTYAPLSILDITLVHSQGKSLWQRREDNAGPSFPADIGIVAPNLTSLRIDGLQISSLPRYELRKAYIANTSLPYTLQHHLLFNTNISKLVLHRIAIPCKRPYRSRAILNPTPSSIASLCLSELQCPAAAGPANDHIDIYSHFFAMSFSPSLLELELAGLSNNAMDGLMRMMLDVTTKLCNVRKLTLRSLPISRVEVGLFLSDVFPGVNELTMHGVRAPWFLTELWQRDMATWPQLTEMVVDLETVKRRDSF